MVQLHLLVRRPLALVAALLAAVLVCGLAALPDPAVAAPAKARPGTGTLSIVPYPSGNTSAKTLPAVASFRPARPGKTVRLLSSTGRTVAQTKQAKDGTALFNVPTTAGASYRAVSLNGRFQGRRVANTVTPLVVARPTSQPLGFSDEFGGSRLDPTKWGLRAEGYHGNRSCSKPSADQVSVSGGTLKVGVQRVAGATSARQEDGTVKRCPRGVWKNGAISTARSTSPHLQAYGYFAARMAMQSSRGMHASFWLQDHSSAGAEIDVIEHFGVGSTDGLTTKIHKTVGRTTQTQTKAGLLKALRGRPATAWNVYSVQWTPQRYVFRINGVVTWQTSRHVSSAQEEIILSLLTSDWNLPNLNQPRSKLQVDWVRTWTHG